MTPTIHPRMAIIDMETTFHGQLDVIPIFSTMTVNDDNNCLDVNSYGMWEPTIIVVFANYSRWSSNSLVKIGRWGSNMGLQDGVAVWDHKKN